MSISTNFPTIKPSLLLDFANVGALDPRITFTRASTGTYYDGVTTAKAEENLLLQSQTFETTWIDSNATVAANSTTAPDGTTTADTLTDTATSGAHLVSQASVPTVVGVDFSVSVYAQAGTLNYVSLSLTNSTISNRYAAITADLSGGTITDSSTANSTIASSSITSVGGGWYRLTLVASSTLTGFTSARIATSNSGTPTYTSFGQPTYSGSGQTVFIWGAQLEQRSSVTAYTATTTQPITNYIPVLQTAAANVARFDHTPTTGEALGLLAEEQRTNLQVYSEDFANAAWLKGNSSITSNTIVAPDGTLTGDKLVEDTATGEHSFGDGFSFTSGTTYTGTIYAKKAERTLCRFGAGNPATWAAGIVVDLSNGTITSTVAGSGTITDVGNGWYRISVTGQALATAVTNFAMRLVSSGTTISYTGDGYSGIFIWGAQLEAGAFPTSYIATTSAQVTRSADAASMTGTNFSEWYSPSGTAYLDGTNGCIFAAHQGSTSSYTNFWQIGNNSAYGVDKYMPGNYNAVIQWEFRVFSGGQGQKYAIAMATNDIAGYIDGVQFGTDSSATLPANINSAYIKVNGVGYFKKLAYYPRRLTNAQLQALTS